MKKIAIVTDSNSGIMPDEIKNSDIFILPMPLIVDGEEFFEERNITQQEFYDRLDSDPSVNTSQPSQYNLGELWNEILKDYEHIIHIPMSSGLSASCDSAKVLSKEYAGKVSVIDNQRISVTLKASVFDAQKMVNDGKSVDEIIEYLNSSKLDASIYIMIPTLKWLKKGGRLTPAAAMIGTLLNIKPVLQIQGGKLDSFAKVMSIKNAEKVMMRAIKNDVETRLGQYNVEYYVVYSKDNEYATYFKNLVEKELGVKITYVDPLSLSVACHIGPGALALACSRIV